jgi:aconitase A
MARGRPPKDIDPDTVVKLAAMNCSSEEIAAWFDVNKKTIERRFMSQLIKGRANGRISLKRKMFDMAVNGHCTMAIWLSKQMLGYTDKVEEKIDASVEERVVYKSEWGQGSDRDKTDS